MPIALGTPDGVHVTRTAARRDIQGLRALAVVIVVAFHAGLPLPGGFVGVDVFFVISGFVITGMLMRQLDRDGSISLRTFYARRIKRLLPALTVVVLVTLALTFLLGSPFDGQQTTTAATAIGASLMFANGVIFLRSGDYFATPPTNNPLLNTWSLSVEEQFYLVFPALLLGLWLWARRRARSSLLTGGLAIGIAMSFVLSLGMTFGRITLHLTDPDWFAFYSSPTRAWEFGVGALVYVVASRRWRNVPRAAMSIVFWSGLGAVAASCFVITEASAFPGWLAVLPVVGTAAVLVAGGHEPFGVAALDNRPMVAVGDASYSWYLWHWPLIAFAVMILGPGRVAPILAALLALALAFLTLRWVENPIRYSGLSGRGVVLLAGCCVVTVVVVSTALILGARDAWANAAIRQMMSQVSAGHLWLDAGCNSANPIQSRGPECTWNGGGSGRSIYLLGDSMAGALSEGVVGAARQLDRPVIAGTKGACPFIDATLYVDGRVDEGCRTLVSDSLQWLADQPPADVVISSTLGYLVIDGVGLADSGQAPAFDYEGKREIYLSALARVVQRLEAAGHRVTVFLPPPGFPRTVMAYDAWRPSQCTTYEALVDVASCGTSRREVDVVDETADLFTAVTDVVARSGGTTVDLRPDLCREGVCATNFGDEWLYLDGSHLTAGMSEKLSDRLRIALSS